MYSQEQIEQFKTIETPFFYYNMQRLEQVLQQAKTAFSKYNFHVHYAVKANANVPVLQKIKEFGFGADCVSGNEVKRAVEVGFAGDQIAFAGVGKADKEINYALEHDIFSFNCESIPELEVINELAAAKNKVARIALRINPDVNANTHKYITTGLEENKFGINVWELDAVFDVLEKLNNLQLEGIHFHIGSQIRDLNAFKNLCTRANEIQDIFADRGITLNHINVGGGLGLDYENPDKENNPDFEEFFSLFNKFLSLRPKQTVHFELGRSLVATCCDLISKVLFVKEGVKTNFAILDAGMTELIRPALYQAYHKIENLTSPNPKQKKYDVVGPICESSDCFGKAVVMQATNRGDLVAIRTCGAYGEVMSSEYNLRDKAMAVYSG